MIVDATAPTVNGLENNKTYCGDVKFTVTDEHLDRVTDTIGEETKTLEAVDGEYTLSAGTHKITATDKAGNKTEVPFGGASLDTNKEDLIAAKGIFTPEEKAEVGNGLVTAVANGTAIITVTTEDGEMTATSTITVNIPSDDNSNKGNNNKPNSKPNTNSVILTDNKKHDNQKVISSKTGDTSDVTLWITVFVAALAGIIGIFAIRKKEQQ